MSTAATAALPLLAAREDLDAPLAWRHGRPISARQYLADVRVQAALLPAVGPQVNLCVDRYAFAVGLGAALARGQSSLLPPNALAETLDLLRAEHPGAYGLSDDAQLRTPGLPLLALPHCHAALRRGEPTTVPRIAADAVAACMLTSGSTGAPQPHAKTWGALTLNIAAEAERLAEFLGQPSLAGLNVVATVPPQHSYGLESSVLLAMLGGAAFEAGRPFYPADIAAALQALPRPRGLVTTPFHLKTLLASGLALPACDLVLSATAPLSPQLAQQAERALAAPLVEIYGCTEAGQVAARRTVRGARWTTLGALRLHRDAEDRNIVQGGHVFEPTPLADVLELDDDRHFRLLGRSGDLIKVAGKRSSLAHLNYHLNSIEGVADGAFWLPDEVADGVVRPVAFVVAPGLSAAEIVAALRSHIEAVFLPRRIVHVDALPREATGKLTAAALRSFALAKLAETGHG